MDLRNNLFQFLHNKIVSFVIIFITLISYCYIDFLSPFDTIFHGLSLALGILYMFLYVISGKYTKFSKALLLFYIIGLVSTLLGTYSNISSYFQVYTRLIGFSLYLEHGFIYYTKNTIKPLNTILWLFVFINFLTICLYPEGMYITERYSNNWFFMYDNTHIMWYFSAVLVSFINNKFIRKKQIKTSILYIIIVFCIIYCRSVNSMIAFGIFVLYLLFKKTISKIKWLNYSTYLKSFVTFNILFVFARIQYAFSWFIVDILGKKLTFTGRTIIWDKVIELIKDSPLLGYGYESTSIFISKMNNIYYTHAHNTLLDICYKGGILLMITFLYILFLIGKSIKECSNKALANFVSVILFCCMIMMIFEAREEKIGLYIIITIASCINCFTFKNSEQFIEGGENNE